MKKTIKKSFAVLLTLLTVVFIMPISSRAVTTDIPSDAVEYNGHYYYAFDENLTWTEAKTKCEAMGGYLATIHSDAEHNVVRSVLKEKSDSFFWIGGYRTDSVSNWQWVTGETFSYDRQKTTSVSGNSSCNYLAMYAGEGAFPAGLMQYWLQLTNNGTFYLIEISCKYHTGYICEWGKPNNSDKRYPIGYDPQKDRWNFLNQTIAIPESIYKKAFGGIKGAVMYFKDCAFASKKPGEGGSCYGMAASTGTFVKNYIDVTSVLCQPISAPGLYASHLYQCWNGSGGIHDSYIPAANMTVSEFVMYGQLSQKDYDMSRQMKNSKYDFEGLYSAAVDYVNGTGEPVVVSMVGELNGQRVGHAIYVCGIGVDNENYTEILVNDSNYPTDVPRKLILNKTNGSYSGWEYDLNSNTHWGTGKKYEKISYSFPSYFLYVVGICNSEMVAEKNSEWMSSEANLVVIDGDAEGLNIDDEKIYPIESSAGIGEIEEDVSGFWIEPGIDEISFISKNDESSIIFANNKVAVDVQTDKNVLTDLTIDEKNYYASIQANKGEKVTLAVHTQSSDNTEYEYTISGNVHENKVSVERNEDNIIFVKGLNNVDINLNKNGNEENTVAAVSDGRQIKISIDDSNNTVIASYESEQTEDICGYCGKVHGTSFKEVLIKFFHRIFYFFVKLFGLKK